MNDGNPASSNAEAFWKVAELLQAQGKVIRKARKEKDGDEVGPWLVIKDGEIIDRGTLNELMERNA